MMKVWLALFLIKTTAFDPLAFLSENQKKGIEDYKKAIGVSTSGNDNSGIAAFNDDFLSKNKCFKKLAENFYQEIRSNDVTEKRNTKRDGRSIDAPSFSIDDRVLEPEKNNGVFWNTALKYANGDKNLAMSLMGICGHDNILQSSTIRCPTEYSNIYYPESLGKGVDISPALKKKIVAAQGDNGSGLYVPNKYYHTIGAATTACLLLRRGVPEALAQTIILTAVNGYRSGRLCETFLKTGFSDYKIEDITNLAIALSDGPKSNSWKEVIGKVKGLSQKPVSTQRKKLEIALSHLDAQSYFLRDSSIMKECQQTKMSGQLTSFLKSWNNESKFHCPPEMETNRCRRLKERITTWAVDREWTEAQHVVGFNFAKKNCPPNLVNNSEIETSACNSLNTANSSQEDSSNIQ